MSKTVAEVMTPDPVVVKELSPLNDAIKVLAEQHFSGVPVVDDTGKLVGILSETDLMWQETGVEPPPYITFLDSVIYLKNPARYEKEIHKALGQTVKDVMSDKPITVKPEQPLREAAQLMHSRDIRRVVVADDQKQVIGILTRGDVVRAMASE
jgi:CBS domain-containing protein